MDMPPFCQSAMDGCAFMYGELKQFDVVGTSQVGDFLNKVLKYVLATVILMARMKLIFKSIHYKRCSIQKKI
jgi:molybdopterin biosynthesis enzyme